MIKNVNLMQNPADVSFDKYSEEYILQALANLGQRIGIKGDGISYKSFTFSEIVNEYTSYSTNKHVGYIRYAKNKDNDQYKAIFGIVDKATLTNYNDITENININDCLYFNSDLIFDIPISGIDKYSKNSICINNGSELTFMLAGRHLGSNDDDKFNTTLYYYKFDINTNKLKYAAKLFHHDTINQNEELFCLITTVNKLYESNNYESDELSDEYNMHINLFNASYLKNKNNNYYYESFIKIFNFNNYYSSSDITFSIIKPEYDDLSYLLHYEEDNESNSAIAIILNSLQDSLYLSRTLSLNYDTNKNEFFSIAASNNEDYIEYFKKEYNINLTEELYYLNEENINLYYNIFNYYNNKFYLDTRVEFIKRILLKLYENVSEHNYESENILYIPLDYQFNYTCNSNNVLNIYDSSNFYVTFTQIDKLNLSEFWENNTNLIYDYDGVDKVKCYNFNVNYNKDNELFINSIYIKTIYTMPYINASYNWSINDNDSKIKAIGKDAGNPNIIIISSLDSNNNVSSYNILNSISNKEYIYNAEYEQRWFNVHPALFDNITDIDIQCCAYIPKLTKKNIDYFKHSIILSLSDLNCLDNEDYKYSYKGSYIFTFWHILEENGNYSFEYIKHQESENDHTYALVLGATVNLLNETDNESLANLNDLDILLLKAIATKIGHEDLQTSTNNWLIIKNKLSEDYIDNTNSVINYKNDLNGVIQYNDNVKIQNAHVIYSQNNKYISDISKLKITNSLYPQYVTTKNEQIITTNSEAVRLLKNSQNNNVIGERVTKIIVDGNLVTNAESLIEKLDKQYDEEVLNASTTIIFETVEKTKSNYNEYLFNENIPTLDFSEVFNRNFNVLNRINILSLDSQGLLYNAYIGTSYNENQKSVLHIGTTNTNINVGSQTLMSEVDKSNFYTHDSLSLDFNTIILNGKDQVISKQNIINQRTIDNITYNIMEFVPIGKSVDTHLNNDSLFVKSWTKQSNGNILTSNDNAISINYIMKNYFKCEIDHKQNVNIVVTNTNFGNAKTLYLSSNNSYYYSIELNNNLLELRGTSTNGNMIKYYSKINIIYYVISDNIYIYIN